VFGIIAECVVLSRNRTKLLYRMLQNCYVR